MKIKIHHATSLSIKIDERIFSVLVDGEDQGPSCWIAAEERGNETDGLLLSEKFASLELARSAWRNGFTVRAGSDPTIKLVLDELLARNYACKSDE
jgi:hypothetical protein